MILYVDNRFLIRYGILGCTGADRLAVGVSRCTVKMRACDLFNRFRVYRASCVDFLMCVLFQLDFLDMGCIWTAPVHMHVQALHIGTVAPSVGWRLDMHGLVRCCCEIH